MTTMKTILATIIVPGAACLLIPYYILRSTGIPLKLNPGIWQVIAIPIAIVGVGMIIWVSVSFVRKGGGTPIPIDPPKHLVVQGLYCYTRNPMYFGAIMVLLAEVIYFASLWVLIYTIILWAILHTFVVVIEEPQLKRRFGVEYESYLASVPRWLPKLALRSGE